MNSEDNSLLNMYCREIRQYKSLSPDEECDVIERMCKGDMQAREKLIESYLRLVVSIAQHPKFSRQEDIMDLIQEGNIGLIQAVDSYIPDSDRSFVGYASICIRNRLIHFVQKSREVLVLDTPVYEDSDEYITCADKLVDEATILSDASYKMVEEDWMSAEMRKELLMALESLPWCEREVLQLLYGLNVRQAMSVQEVAMLLDVTPKRVGQIRQKALQHALRAMTHGG